MWENERIRNGYQWYTLTSIAVQKVLENNVSKIITVLVLHVKSKCMHCVECGCAVRRVQVAMFEWPSQRRSYFRCSGHLYGNGMSDVCISIPPFDIEIE